MNIINLLSSSDDENIPSSSSSGDSSGKIECFNVKAESRKSASASKFPSNQNIEQLDDDIAVVGDGPEVMSFPHARHDCLRYPFSDGSLDYRRDKVCDNCYCYVCDVIVSECKEWKTGHHYNASSNVVWKDIRKKKKANPHRSCPGPVPKRPISYRPDYNVTRHSATPYIPRGANYIISSESPNMPTNCGEIIGVVQTRSWHGSQASWSNAHDDFAVYFKIPGVDRNSDVGIAVRYISRVHNRAQQGPKPPTTFDTNSRVRLKDRTTDIIIREGRRIEKRFPKDAIASVRQVFWSTSLKSWRLHVDNSAATCSRGGFFSLINFDLNLFESTTEPLTKSLFPVDSHVTLKNQAQDYFHSYIREGYNMTRGYDRFPVGVVARVTNSGIDYISGKKMVYCVIIESCDHRIPVRCYCPFELLEVTDKELQEPLKEWKEGDHIALKSYTAPKDFNWPDGCVGKFLKYTGYSKKDGAYLCNINIRNIKQLSEISCSLLQKTDAPLKDAPAPLDRDQHVIIMSTLSIDKIYNTENCRSYYRTQTAIAKLFSKGRVAKVISMIDIGENGQNDWVCELMMRPLDKHVWVRMKYLRKTPKSLTVLKSPYKWYSTFGVEAKNPLVSYPTRFQNFDGDIIRRVRIGLLLPNHSSYAFRSNLKTSKLSDFLTILKKCRYPDFFFDMIKEKVLKLDTDVVMTPSPKEFLETVKYMKKAYELRRTDQTKAEKATYSEKLEESKLVPKKGNELVEDLARQQRKVESEKKNHDKKLKNDAKRIAEKTKHIESNCKKESYKAALHTIKSMVKKLDCNTFWHADSKFKTIEAIAEFECDASSDVADKGKPLKCFLNILFKGKFASSLSFPERKKNMPHIDSRIVFSFLFPVADYPKVHEMDRSLRMLSHSLNSVKNIETARVNRRQAKTKTLPGLLQHCSMDSDKCKWTHVPQPPGFHSDVVMREYQRQSLSFMLNEERREGGINSHFWLPIKNEDKKTIYYSPVLHKFARKETIEKLSLISGGFLCDEMGLGKTIVSLALILANPAPRTSFSCFKQKYLMGVGTSNNSRHNQTQVTREIGKAIKDWGKFSKSQKEIYEVMSKSEDCLVQCSDPNCGKWRPIPQSLGAPCSGPFKCKDNTWNPSEAKCDAPVSTPVYTAALRDNYKIGSLEITGDNARTLIPSRATLVLCAVSLVGQWQEEARRRCKMNIYAYHGSNRIRKIRILSEFDIVVTTYQTLAADVNYRRKGQPPANNMTNGRSPLHLIKWHRIIVDESHSIKCKSAKMSVACCALSSNRRWCVTGTPFNNSTNDLAGQLHFLGLHGFNAWEKYVNKEYSTYKMGYRLKYLPPLLHQVLEKLMVRHEKVQMWGDPPKPLLKLPPKEETQRIISWDAETKVIYKRMEKSALEKYEVIKNGGTQNVSRNTLLLFSYLRPLRLLCSSGTSSTDSEVSTALIHPNVKHAEYMALTVSALEECSICLDIPEYPVASVNCKHVHCYHCLSKVNQCPVCRSVSTRLRPVKLDKQPVKQVAVTEVAKIIKTPKIKALLEELKTVRTKDSAAKVLIFSQFKDTLDNIKKSLTFSGYQYRTLTGDMSMKARAKALSEFQNDPPTTVFVLSMRSGAVGINLTQANHIFLMEACMNQALEDQAVGRVYRIGQKRSVKIRRFLMGDSIEMRIRALAIQKSRGSSENGSVRKRISTQSIAGSVVSDKQALRAEEFQNLFDPNSDLKLDASAAAKNTSSNGDAAATSTSSNGDAAATSTSSNGDAAATSTSSNIDAAGKDVNAEVPMTNEQIKLVRPKNCKAGSWLVVKRVNERPIMIIVPNGVKEGDSFIVKGPKLVPLSSIEKDAAINNDLDSMDVDNNVALNEDILPNAKDGMMISTEESTEDSILDTVMDLDISPKAEVKHRNVKRKQCDNVQDIENCNIRKRMRLNIETPDDSENADLGNSPKLDQCIVCDVKTQPNGSKLQLCGGCKVAKYCSQKCQLLDWKLHMGECSSFSGQTEKLTQYILSRTKKKITNTLQDVSEQLGSKKSKQLAISEESEGGLQVDFVESIDTCKKEKNNTNSKRDNRKSRRREIIDLSIDEEIARGEKWSVGMKISVLFNGDYYDAKILKVARAAMTIKYDVDGSYEKLLWTSIDTRVKQK